MFILIEHLYSIPLLLTTTHNASLIMTMSWHLIEHLLYVYFRGIYILVELTPFSVC